MKTSFWTELLDLIAPRRCAICGSRLTATDALLCRDCQAELPKTPFHTSPYDNPMARLFWGQFPVEKAAAWFYYHPKSDPSRMIYDMKYHGNIYLAQDIGEQMALWLQPSGFFDGIDGIVPVPITPGRRRQRGYNQSEQVSRGLSEVTHLPVFKKVLSRQEFMKSQTHENAWERRENVKAAFRLTDGAQISGHHVLLVDDVVTTGATIIACGQTLAEAGDVKVSVLAVGYTKE